MIRKLLGFTVLLFFLSCSKDSGQSENQNSQPHAEESINEESTDEESQEEENAESGELLDNEIYNIVETTFTLPEGTVESSLGKLEITGGLQVIEIDKFNKQSKSNKKVEIVYPVSLSLGQFGVSTVEVTNDGKALGYAINIPGSSLKIDAESTAITLVFMHPFLQSYDITTATGIIERIKNSSNFENLKVEVIKMMQKGELNINAEDFDPTTFQYYGLVARDVLNSLYQDVNILENGIEIIDIQETEEFVNFKVRNRRKRWLKVFPSYLIQGRDSTAKFYSSVLDLEYPFGYVKSLEVDLLKEALNLNWDLSSLKHDSNTYTVKKSNAEKLVLNLYGIGLKDGIISDDFLQNHFDVFAITVFQDYLMPIAETATGISGLKQRIDSEIKIVGRPLDSPLKEFVKRFLKHYEEDGSLHLEISLLWSEGKIGDGIYVLLKDMIEYLVSDEDGNSKLLYDAFKEFYGSDIIQPNSDLFKKALKSRLTALKWIQIANGVSNISSALRGAMLSDEHTEKIIDLTVAEEIPDTPFNPKPADQSIDVPLSSEFSFTPGDGQDNGEYSFHLFLDTQNPPNRVVDYGINKTTFQVGDLESSTTYYWKIETGKDGQLVNESSVWSFTTVAENAGVQPANTPNPVDGATDISQDIILSFEVGDSTPTDATFRLYFGPDPSPEFYFDLGTENSYSITELSENLTYYWTVETVDGTSGDVLATSEEWSFTTAMSNTSVSDDVFILENRIDAFEITNDGNHFYYAGDGELYHYILSTPYDLTTASLSDQKTIPNFIKSIQVSDNGDKLYLHYDGSGGRFAFRQYEMSTAFSVIDMNLISTLSKFYDSSARSLQLVDNSNSLILAYCDYFSTIIENLRQYDVSGDILIEDSEVVKAIDTKSVMCLRNFAFSLDGNLIYAIEPTTNPEDYVLRKFNVTSPFDIETIDFVNEIGQTLLRAGERIFFMQNSETYFTLRKEGNTWYIAKRTD